MTGIRAIGFDADDTLWKNLIFFQEVEAAFDKLLADQADPKTVQEALLAVQRVNVPLYGYGVKSLTLSMIETAANLWDGPVPQEIIHQIMTNGKDLLCHPIEFMDGAKETLVAISKRYPLFLITKGDLKHQEAKVFESKLGPLFERIEIVSNKDSPTYRGIFGDDIQNCVMVGDSMASDIRPMLDAGGYAVHIPPAAVWIMEEADKPIGHPKFHEVTTIRDVVFAIEQIEESMRP